MIRRVIVPALLLALLAVPAPAQEKKEGPKLEPGGRRTTPAEEEKPAPASPAETAAAVTEHHERLETFVGNWKAEIRVWPAPGAEPLVGRGIVRNQRMLGGRFLRSDFKGELRDESFQGFGVEGYDNLKQRHVAFWMDSLGTGVVYFEGECADDGKVRTLTGEYTDPETGETKKRRAVTTVRSYSRYTYEEQELDESGEWFTVLRAVFDKQ